MKEVCALVLHKDAVRGGGLEVERDVAAGLSSVQREVQVGGGATEGRCIPVVAFKSSRKDTLEAARTSTLLVEKLPGGARSLTVSFAPQGAHGQLGLRPGSAGIANHHLADRKVVLVQQQP